MVQEFQSPPTAATDFSYPLPDRVTLQRLATEENCIRAREHRGYSLYNIDQQLIYTRYHYPLDYRLRPKEREWENIHQVLSHLDDLPGVPKSHGFVVEHTELEQCYHSLRQYLIGEQVAAFNSEDASWLGDFFARLHQRLVTTNDPQPKNFLRDCVSGQLCFIDFGNSTLFKQRGPLFCWQVARELLKIRRSTLSWDSALWRIFLAHYNPRVLFSLPEWLLIRCLYWSQIPWRWYRESRLGISAKGRKKRKKKAPQ